MISNLIRGFVTILVGSMVLSEMSNGIELIGWTTDVKPYKQHKQTYLEYVEERLAVERMLR